NSKPLMPNAPPTGNAFCPNLLSNVTTLYYRSRVFPMNNVNFSNRFSLLFALLGFLTAAPPVFAQNDETDLTPLRTAIQTGQFSQAEAELDYFLAKRPNDPEILLLKATLIYQSYALAHNRA